MDSSGFSAPRSDCFPAGLRVLVVDDDPTWLKILEKMLKKCNYEVMTCNLAREALDLLRERKDGFDIVISDVNMPDMDGFKLLEHVGLEMDLPVIMMSVDGETSRVMKGVQHGACDYLLKPIRMKELRNIWQHVLRKRMHEVRDIEGHEIFEEYQLLRNGTEQSDDSYSFSGDLISGKKRKDDNKHDDKVCGDPSSVKKARVIWTIDLHQKFVKAVNQIGLSKVGPKKILDLMGVPWLTRENVASHLQKYRLYLSRLQKENELKVTFGGIKNSEISSKNTAGDVCHQKLSTQNPITTQQNMVTNEGFVVSVHKNLIQDNDNNISDGNVKGLFSIPVAASKKPLLGDMNESLKSSTSRISFNNSFGPLDSDIKSQLKIQAKYSWSADVPLPMYADVQLPLHPIQVDSKEPILAHTPGPSNKEPDKPTRADFKPSYGKSRDQGITKVESTAALFSIQPESHLTDCLSLNPIPCPMSNVKNFSLVQNLFDDMESSQSNLILETGSALKLWDEVLNGSCFQGDFHSLNTDLGNIESIDFSNKELIDDVPPNFYDSLNFDYEYVSDAYPVIGQGLYIA